jgi:hypothetical protein
MRWRTYERKVAEWERARSATPLGAWLRGLLARTHANTAVVALANKLARIAWAVLRHNRNFSSCGAVVSSKNRPIVLTRALGVVCGWWKRDGLTVDRYPVSL